MKLDWQTVANAAGNCSPEIAEAVIYMIFQFAAHFVNEGNHISIEMHLGRLLIRPGNIEFKMNCQLNRNSSLKKRLSQSPRQRSGDLLT